MGIASREGHLVKIIKMTILTRLLAEQCIQEFILQISFHVCIRISLKVLVTLCGTEWNSTIRETNGVNKEQVTLRCILKEEYYPAVKRNVWIRTHLQNILNTQQDAFEFSKKGVGHICISGVVFVLTPLLTPTVFFSRYQIHVFFPHQFSNSQYQLGAYNSLQF